MVKVKLVAKLKSPDENHVTEVNGIARDNKIIYSDDSIKTTLTFDNRLHLIRENDEYKFEFVFEENKKTLGKYTLKMYNQSMDVIVNTYQVLVNNNMIKLKYQLFIDDDDCGIFEYQLNYEKI